jgi:hypothetical protein
MLENGTARGVTVGSAAMGRVWQKSDGDHRPDDDGFHLFMRLFVETGVDAPDPGIGEVDEVAAAAGAEAG